MIGANVNTGAQTDGRRGRRRARPAPRRPTAGLQKGDVVTGVDGKPITDGISLIVAIRSHQPGETINLAVRRAGEEQDVKVRLDAKVG